MRLTVACPEALTPAANHLAMVLAEGPADARTYANINWQDADGTLYAVASFEAREEWIAGAQQPLQRPAWDTEQIIDMNAAVQAQAAIVLWIPNEDAPTPPTAKPGALTVIGGVHPLDAIRAMGLTGVDNEPA